MLRFIMAFVLAPAFSLALAAPPALAQMDAREAEQCRMSCMLGARDASDPRYRNCVRQRCSATAAPAQRRSTTQSRPANRAAAAPPAAAAGAAAIAAEAWSLGDHPALGPGVMIQTDQGVIGLACMPDGVALRVTNGMFRGPALGWITDNGSAGGTVALQPGEPFSQTAGTACALGVPGLATAGSVVLIDAPVTPRGGRPGQGYDIDAGGMPVAVTSGADLLARMPGARLVTLAGFGAAVAPLTAQCPALAGAFARPCP